ncbi:MAG: dephospho-CoA kinase [Paludibacteraceae bacterium]|nr:dephospho-CoA kinase [Paludibacteraceae bacterium]
MNIYVIGYMASGKSTLVHALEQQTGRPSIDTDEQIQQRSRKSCYELVKAFGEEIFRKMEHELLREICQQTNLLVATGGGLPCYANNMSLMNQTGVTVYLRWNVENLAIRAELSGIDKRPLMAGLRGEDLRSFISRHLADRIRYYEQARYIIDCDGMTDEQIAKQVMRDLL